MVSNGFQLRRTLRSHALSYAGNQEKQLLDVSGCLYRLEEQMSLAAFSAGDSLLPGHPRDRRAGMKIKARDPCAMARRPESWASWIHHDPKWGLLPKMGHQMVGQL